MTAIAPALAEIKELMSRNADQQLRAVTTPSIDQELFVRFAPVGALWALPFPILLFFGSLNSAMSRPLREPG